MNPYEVLGIEPQDCSPELVKDRHRQRRWHCHPDRGGSEESMIELNQARDILLSPDRKRRFDETGSTDSGPLGIQEQAQVILGNLFVSAIEQAPADMRYYKILGLIASEVSKGYGKALEANKLLPERIRRAKEILKAVDCDPLLRKIFESRIAKLEASEAEINQQISLGEMMMKLMKSVTFK